MLDKYTVAVYTGYRLFQGESTVLSGERFLVYTIFI